MKFIIGNSILEFVQGDITQQDTVAVVNAANSELAPGGGVAGAIHRTAGPKLWEECKSLGGCKTGEAKITAGYALKAKYIIHTVGPIYGSTSNDPLMLSSSYEQSLRLATQYNIESISFPAISTGAFGYPIEEAGEIAVRSVVNYLTRHPEIKLVRFVLFSQSDLREFETAAQKLIGNDKKTE
jgi:O-acetyl-ADP-ribose deacetylase